MGYDRPFADNPSFNAPLFTDLLLMFMPLLALLALGLSIWAVVRSVYRLRGGGNGIENNVPAARILTERCFRYCWHCNRVVSPIIWSRHARQWTSLWRLVLAENS